MFDGLTYYQERSQT